MAHTRPRGRRAGESRAAPYCARVGGMAARYRLDLLRTLRQRSVEEQTLRLAEQLSEAARAERALLDKQAERERQEGDAERGRAQERALLGKGNAKVADLVTQAEWRQTLEQRADLLREQERAAVEELRAARAEQRSRQTALAQASAEAKAIERHHERWKRAEEATVERSAEQEVSDQWSGRHVARDPRGGKA